MACHDGSQASIDALSTIFNGVVKGMDTITVAHVFSLAKEEYLPYNLKNGHIKDQCNATLVTMGSRYKYADESSDKSGLSAK